MKIKIRYLILPLSLYLAPVSAEVVNVNKADVETLQNYLIGVDSKFANSLVVYRTLYGPIVSFGDLARIPGITPQLIADNKSKIGFRHGIIKGMGYVDRTAVATRAILRRPAIKQDRSNALHQAQRYYWVRLVKEGGE